MTKTNTLSQARRARRQSRTNSATSGDDTKREGHFLFQQNS
jgi:hypothetical protein